MAFRSESKSVGLTTAPRWDYGKRRWGLQLPETQRSFVIKRARIEGISCPLPGKIIHWRTIFEVHNGKEVKFIEVDTHAAIYLLDDPDYEPREVVPSVPNTIRMGLRDHAYSNSAPPQTRFESDFRDDKTITFKELVDLIKEKGLDRYWPDENGYGCLHWATKLLGAIIGKRWFKSQEQANCIKSKLDAFVKEKNIDGEHWIPGGKGIFY